MLSSQRQYTVSKLPWPEPLVIELIGDHLDQQGLSEAMRRTLSREHAAAFRDMLAGRAPEWQTARRRLRERYATLGIPLALTAVIDRAVLFELTHVAAYRFRTSPRRRHDAAEALRAAVARLSALMMSERPLAA